MTPDLRHGETTRLSTGERLLLIVVAVPFFGVSCFIGIAYVCGLLDYRLFGTRD